MNIGDRVYVRHEKSAGTVVAVPDEICESVDVRVDSDGVVVSCAIAQCRPLIVEPGDFDTEPPPSAVV